MRGSGFMLSYLVEPPLESINFLFERPKCFPKFFFWEHTQKHFSVAQVAGCVNPCHGNKNTGRKFHLFNDNFRQNFFDEFVDAINSGKHCQEQKY